MKARNRVDQPLPSNNNINLDTLRKTSTISQHFSQKSLNQNNHRPDNNNFNNHHNTMSRFADISAVLNTLPSQQMHHNKSNNCNNEHIGENGENNNNGVDMSCTLAESELELIVQHSEINLQNLSKLLEIDNIAVRKRAAGYIQHLAFRDRRLGNEQVVGKIIPQLITCLSFDEVRMEAVGAITNLTYDNIQNKIKVRDNNGVQEITRCVLSEKEDANCWNKLVPICNCLWNLSAAQEELGKVVTAYALPTLITHVLSLFTYQRSDNSLPFPPESEKSMQACIAILGVMKNVSSIPSARRALRDRAHLIDDLLWFLKNGLQRGDVNGKLVENATCTLRNLVYNLHLEAPNCREFYQKLEENSEEEDPKFTVMGFCVGLKSKKKLKVASISENEILSQIPVWTEETTGWELLPYSTEYFINILRDTKDCDSPNDKTIEAALAILQNLCSGGWNWAYFVRNEIIKKHNALPDILEKINHSEPLVVASAAGCLKNLCKKSGIIDMIGSEGLSLILESQIQEHPLFSENRRIGCQVYTRNHLIAFLNVLNLLIRLIGGSENCSVYTAVLADHPDVLRVLVGIAGETWKNISPVGTLNTMKSNAVTEILKKVL